MAASMDSGKWVFTKEQLQNTPSRRCNIDYDKEIFYRQQAATLIQEMGQRLQVTQLCINTAIVYVHRFYMFHSFNKFHRNPISSCALFLAAKVEEQPRKLEHVIRVAHMILYKDQRHLDINSEQYIEQAQELINNENILLQTLGFDVAIDHPHTQVLKCCQHLFRASSSKDMAQTSYFMATNSLHLTTMCLQYKPTVVACVCIHLVCKWFNFEIPQSAEGKDWFWYVDKSVTLEMLDELTVEFLAIFNKCPSRLRKRVMQQPGVNASAMTSSDKTASGTSKDSSTSHQDAHKIRNESSGSTAPKPGERIPRPHDQRRDKTGAPLPPSSSTASVPVGHRPSSNSGHPPSHSNRPPEGAGLGVGGSSTAGSHHHHHHHHQQQQQQQHHQQQPSGHSSSRPPHPHQRSSSGSAKETKQPVGSSSSSASHPPSVQHHHHQQHQQQQHQQQRLQQPPVPQNTLSSQRKPVAPNVLPSNKVQQPSSGGSSSSSLFSPPRVEQQPERKPIDSTSRTSKPSTSAFGQDWPGNGNVSGANSAVGPSQQTQMNLSTSLGFSLDLDICEDQDSTWDINYGLEPNSLLGSPNAAIESMLMNNATGDGASTSGFQTKQQQSLFSMLEPSPKLQQSVQQQQLHSINPQLPSTPQPQVTPQQQQQQQQQQHQQQQQQQQQQQPPQVIQQPSLRESLFDVVLDHDQFSSVKTEDAMTCVEIKSTPAAEVVVSAPTDGGEDVDSSSGKKKKKKKEKHKNKDKDREGKEKEKKHKHKHKGKDKEKEKTREKDKYKDAADGPRLKISGINQSPVQDQAALVKPVLKIKIPKGRIEGEVATTPTNGSNESQPLPAASPMAPGGGLKIKISREMISSNNSKEKESSRKRSSTTSSSSLNKTSLPSAKLPKIEAIPQQQQQQQQQSQPPQQQQHHPPHQQQHHFQTASSNARPHHERNGSSSSNVVPEESRQRSHSAHRSSTNMNKL
ncbi:cyclin-T1 isoform X2 [Daphnia magna]|uniref:cyclin-T1 isoform X2 n=1 Tax=Daphnia magna TaxID=35525 RepID=UPI001E1BD0EE|nr:cyclin-T1 isoform X2 [Daphnia magna]